MAAAAAFRSCRQRFSFSELREKKTLPKGKKTELATGARMAYEKHKVHLWGQLEKFFAEFNGGQSTYTPRTV